MEQGPLSRKGQSRNTVKGTGLSETFLSWQTGRK